MSPEGLRLRSTNLPGNASSCHNVAASIVLPWQAETFFSLILLAPKHDIRTGPLGLKGRKFPPEKYPDLGSDTCLHQQVWLVGRSSSTTKAQNHQCSPDRRQIQCWFCIHTVTFPSFWWDSKKDERPIMSALNDWWGLVVMHICRVLCLPSTMDHDTLRYTSGQRTGHFPIYASVYQTLSLLRRADLANVGLPHSLCEVLFRPRVIHEDVYVDLKHPLSLGMVSASRWPITPQKDY